MASTTRPLDRAAAMLAAAALCTACATVQTTDTGEIGLERKQYFADGAREKMVLAAATSYDEILDSAMRAGALNADPARTERVVAIANRLIPHVTAFRPDALDWEWEVNVLHSDMVNASCMAGGKVFVFTGLLDQWQPSDDELAAVIGHEIGHALRDHSAEKYSTSRRNNSVAAGLGSILSIGFAATTGVNLSGTIGSASRLGAEAFANLPNSRELEHESDRIGLELMARAGYNPMAAASLWRKVAEQAKAKGSERNAFWSTHPSDEGRVQELVAAEPRVRHLYLAAQTEARPAANRAIGKEASK